MKYISFSQKNGLKQKISLTKTYATVIRDLVYIA
jgi:hypothetical protein